MAGSGGRSVRGGGRVSAGSRVPVRVVGVLERSAVCSLSAVGAGEASAVTRVSSVRASRMQELLAVGQCLTDCGFRLAPVPQAMEGDGRAHPQAPALAPILRRGEPACLGERFLIPPLFVQAVYQAAVQSSDRAPFGSCQAPGYTAPPHPYRRSSQCYPHGYSPVPRWLW